jgi:hypothetical protein
LSDGTSETPARKWKKELDIAEEISKLSIPFFFEFGFPALGNILELEGRLTGNTSPRSTEV